MRKKLTLLLMLCAVCLFAGCGATKINLNEYLDVDYDGVDGYGTAEFEIDWDDIIKDNKDIFGYSKRDLEDTRDGQRFYEEVMEAISGKLNKTEKLSNGDELVFEWDVDGEQLEKDFKVKFVYENYTETVEKLDELKKVDAFEGVEIMYSGPSGFASAWLDTSNQQYYQFYYNVELPEKVSNGDKITVTLMDGYLDACVQAGIIPKETSKTYVVKDLQELQEFDAFLGFQVWFEGVAPFGYWNYNESAVKYDELVYQLVYDDQSKNGKLKNGDTITVEISEYSVQKIIDRYGEIPAELTKTYEVSGLDTLVMNFDEIPEEKWLEMYNEWATFARTNVPAEWETPSALTGVKYIGRSISRPTEDSWYQDRYYITLFYELTVQQEGAEPFNYYYYYEFENWKLASDGTYTYTNYQVPYGYQGWFSASGDIFTVDDLYYIGFQTFDQVYEKIIVNDRSYYNTECEFLDGYQYSLYTQN